MGVVNRRSGGQWEWSMGVVSGNNRWEWSVGVVSGSDWCANTLLDPNEPQRTIHCKLLERSSWPTSKYIASVGVMV